MKKAAVRLGSDTHNLMIMMDYIELIFAQATKRSKDLFVKMMALLEWWRNLLLASTTRTDKLR